MARFVELVKQKERRANIKDKEKLNSMRAGAKTNNQECGTERQK
jgi:hypothetical protein